MSEKSKTHWEAHPETTENDNFATSIYSPGYEGVLVARCNQNGRYPEHVAMILNATEAKSAGAEIIAKQLAEIERLQARVKVLEDGQNCWRAIGIMYRDKPDDYVVSVGHWYEAHPDLPPAFCADVRLTAGEIRAALSHTSEGS